MRKGLLFVLLLFCVQQGKAQDFEGDARSITDTLFSRMDSASSANLSENAWTRTFDSVTRSLVLAHLNGAVSKGEYSWPFWYLQRIGEYWPNKDTAIRYPTETGKYLLKSKYNISMDGVSNGCLFQNAFVLHDSLMLVAIRNEYGEDFFGRSFSEAADMERTGRGLMLPFIKMPDSTALILKRVLKNADTRAGRRCGVEQKLYLLIEFSGDTVSKAFWGESFLGRPQFSPELFNPEEKLTEKVRSLSWQGPRFNHLPAEAEVIFDFDEKTLSFR